MKNAAARPAKSRAETSPALSSLRSAQLRRARGEQVAAVCYRIRGGGIEFLLVQSRGGRWIFPKGSIECGLTYAQSAALEALEEAGVHGRIEETSFARYLRRERGGRRSSVKGGTLVHAYLCEVRRLGRPHEADRKRTWFTAQNAKRHLQEARAEDFGAELAGVVDRALARIQQLHNEVPNTPELMPRDALHKVRFEAFENAGMRGAITEAALIRYSLQTGREARSSNGATSHVQELLPAGAPERNRRALLRLGTGAGSTSAKI